MRRRIESTLGGEVVADRSSTGGFSKGTASRVETRTGGTGLVKAVSRAHDVDSYDLYRREGAVLQLLAPLALPAPDLRLVIDDGDWIALVFDVVDGHHPAADDPTAHRAVLDGLVGMPAIEVPMPALADAAAEISAMTRGFREMTAFAGAAALPAWARDHHHELVALTRSAPGAIRGNRLVHFDFRADNALIDTDGRLRVIDWTWASVGCGWLDSLTYLLDARVHGGGSDADDLIETHPVFADASRGDIDSALASFAAYFLYATSLPSPAHLSDLRAFQRLEASVVLEWLAMRRGWKIEGG
ncbi:aminoglycoside phosphotransferase [Amnibacterium flavum]|uniref:Aminoglycoside phosphotransferase n=1 Tax=Amnibacterium flavum TaxID=2173173 RepID=A0A2V1HW38_9MICO|nr:aminoglycoside phosphotransferase [Amnibacterium flavum]